jgi:hypothetical protein
MNWRRWALVLHRDLGYFFTGVVVLYAISGLAVNHVDDWNPDYVVERQDVALQLPSAASDITREHVLKGLSALGEAEGFRSFDFPSADKIKIYLKDGDIVASLRDGRGTREAIRRRPIIYQLNLLHLNPQRWWRVFSDLFAIALVVIALTGLLVTRGRHGFLGRGKWLAGAGLLVPLAAMFALQ